jgi:hypothetical protein
VLKNLPLAPAFLKMAIASLYSSARAGETARAT